MAMMITHFFKKTVLCTALLFTSAISTAYTAQGIPSSFDMQIGAFHKIYPVVAPKGAAHLRVVYVSDFVDNHELNGSAATELAMRIKRSDMAPIEDIVLLMPGDKANQFGTLLFQKLGCKDLVIVRSTDKGGSALSIEYSSITSKDPKKLHLTPDQLGRIEGKRALLIDDVLSTGGTLKALTKLAEEARVQSIEGYAVVATEGEKREVFMGKKLFVLNHLPVWDMGN